MYNTAKTRAEREADAAKIELPRTFIKPPVIVNQKVWRPSNKGAKVYSRKGRRPEF